jgi:hypothetical protein
MKIKVINAPNKFTRRDTCPWMIDVPPENVAQERPAARPQGV